MSAAHDVFQAIADPTRRQVLSSLTTGELFIEQISEQFPISRPAIAKHLKILSDAKLVIPRKEGRKKYYTLNVAPLQQVTSWLSYFESFWDEKLHNLKQLAETSLPEESSTK